MRKLWLCALTGFMLVTLTGCEAERQRQERTASYIESDIYGVEFREVPEAVASDKSLAITWIYWHRAYDIVEAWLEIPTNVDVYKVTTAIGEELTTMDSEGVDQDAIAAIASLAHAFTQQHAILKLEQIRAAANTFSDIASSSGGGMSGMGPGSGGSNPGLTSAGSGIGHGVSGAVSVVQQQAVVMVIAHITTAGHRVFLIQRYGDHFQPISLERFREIRRTVEDD